MDINGCSVITTLCEDAAPPLPLPDLTARWVTQCAGQPAEIPKLPLRAELPSRRLYVLWARLFVRGSVVRDPVVTSRALKVGCFLHT